MKKLYLNLMLVVCMMSVGMNVWGAGYTRTLTENLEVPGYKVNTLYNFQTNTPDVLPTEGDLRYRDGNIWGLHNFGSGTRNASVNISVTKGQLLVLQDYSASYPTTVNVGTLNEALSATTGYRCFEITSSADAITLTTPRYGGVVAALLMDKDESAETTSYTINYSYNDEIIKTTSEDDIAIGTTISAESSVWVGDIKYIALDGQTMSMQLSASDNILNINLREAEMWSHTIQAVDEESNILNVNLASGTFLEGESVTLSWSKYIQVEGQWFVTNANYRGTFSENGSSNIIYSQVNINYFFEETDFTLSGKVAATITKDFLSNGSALRLQKNSYEYSPALDGGIYTMIVAGCINTQTPKLTYGYRLNDANVVLGETESFTNGSYEHSKTIEGVMIPEGASFCWMNNTEYNSNLYIDYIVLIKTSDLSVPATIGSTLYTTFCSEYALDLKNLPEGLTAYYVTESGVAENAVTLTEANVAVPAGTGLVLKGTAAGTYNIPIATSAEALEGNLLVGVLTAETVAKEDGYMKYVLAKSGDNAVFQYIGETAANVPAGKAYIKMEEATGGPGAAGEGDTPTVNPAKMLNIYLPGEATAIKTVAPAEQLNGAIYNLAGQRVGKDYKGIVIMNGKKILVK